MSKRKMYVAEVQVYRTPDAETAKGLFSVGMSIASRLNGNADFTGSFNPNRVSDDPLWISFVTFRSRFGQPESNSLEGDALAEAVAVAKAEAMEFAKEKAKAFPVLSTLNESEWEWGDELPGASGNGAEYHAINFIDPEERVRRLEAKKNPMTKSEPTPEKVEKPTK